METANDNITSFTVGDKAYVIKYTIERVQLYEDAYGSIGRLLYTGDVFIKLSQLYDLMACATKEVGGDYVNPAIAHDMAKRVVEENGYYDTLIAVWQQLQKDCGFLFMAFGESMM